MKGYEKGVGLWREIINLMSDKVGNTCIDFPLKDFYLSENVAAGDSSPLGATTCYQMRHQC